MIPSGESTAGECSQATTLLGKIFTSDDLQIRTTDAPGSTWIRYAQVSSTFKMIFKCFNLSARHCLAFMFLYAMFIKNSDVFANKTVKVKTREQFI
jgi:hypothetical protein